ncbi:MAG TPA: response regulator transcription factor, partial [Saprospiraceae bacterium]|nr:response regulator transcription factor [Saprospiraceae bacterium]
VRHQHSTSYTDTMIRVSIVEDQPDILNSLVRRIDRTEGMICVSQFSNAEDALERIPAQHPDLVLMDIGLPKMDGVECMIRIKLQAPEVDFLMFTVFDADDYVFDALKAGAVGYVLKNEGAAGVVKAIEEYALGGAPMSREIARKVLGSFHIQYRRNTSGFEELTPQQLLILEQLSQGLLNKEIGDRLGISEGTVKQHNYAIYKKLQVNNRTEAVQKYLNNRP